MREIKNAAIIGMGALGMLYADLIIQNIGPEAVCFVADSGRVEKYKAMDFTVNGVGKHFPIVDSQEAAVADLVIVAVKYNALASALDTMKNCVGPETTIISVMNGITSEEIIGERYGDEKLVYAIAQGMDAVKFGGDLNYTRPGELRIGIRDKRGNKTAVPDGSTVDGADKEVGDCKNPIGITANACSGRGGATECGSPENDAAEYGSLECGFLESNAAEYGSPECGSPEYDSASRLDALTRFFTRAGIAYTVEEDIMYRLWGKFMLNVGLNQTCMAFETDYGGSLEPGKTYDTLVGAMHEVMAVAHAEGIDLKEEDITFYIDLIRTLSPSGRPSMRQDGIAKRPSEVEMFSGALRKMAAKHGIPVPVNDWLYGRIKELEAGH